MLLSFYKKHRFLVLFSFLFLLLRLPSLFEPYWYGDEGIYLVLGQAIRKGLTLYRDIHDNKPPTLYYLAAISQTVFGFRLLLALWMIPTIYAFYLLSKKLFSYKLSLVSSLLFLVLTSIPLIEGNIANAEVFMLLPTIIGVYLIFNQSRFGLPSKVLAAAGFLLGFAFTIKVPVVFEFIFLLLWITLVLCQFNLKKIKFLFLVKKIAIFSVSFILPTLICFFYFWSRGAVQEYLFSSLFQNFGYLSSWTTGSHSGSAASGGLVIRGAILILFWLFIVYCSLKKIISQHTIFISLWFSAALFGVLLSTRPYPHYLIQLVPSLILLLVSLFVKPHPRFYFLLPVSLFIFFIFTLFRYHFYFYPVISYYGNFYSHIFSLQSPSYRQYYGNNVSQNYEVSDYISTHSFPTEKLFVWGDEPYIYALADRLPVGRFTVAYHIADFQQYSSTMDQLKINYPVLIVYYPQPNRPFPELDSFIDRYYSPLKAFGSVIIYQKIH